MAAASVPPSAWHGLPPPGAEEPAFMRLWRAFMSARVAIAVVLTMMFAVLLAIGPAGNIMARWLLGLCGTYLLAALAVQRFTQPAPPGRAFDPQWVSTIGVDLLAFSTLQYMQAGGMNYTPLFALPVLTAGVMGSTLLALGTAAGVTLLLLTDAWVHALQVTDEYATRFVQAGLTGTGYFAIALLANQLAMRLAREEHHALRNQLAARAQAQVNALVIESLSDGLLVIDAEGTVQAANPAACELLGWQAPQALLPLRLADQAALEPLAEVAIRTFAHGPQGEAAVSVLQAAGERRMLRVRTRLTPPHGPQAEGLCVMFLQDLREMEARLRTEKLAAMGRMSAAVAHEIRNPLAAITQANALLAEELQEPGQQKLSAMVQQNAQRLSRIVEDVLDIARVQQQHVQVAARLDLDEAAGTLCQEWARHMQAGGRLLMRLGAPGQQVVFESEHLRRVLVNLLDNALRYASQQPDAIRVSTSRAPGEALLAVWSDGAPIEQSVQRHLFEPFFSSESRSSGLGLYICRELCERHGATIGLRRSAGQPGGREGNEFFVRFRTHAGSARPSPFDTITA